MTVGTGVDDVSSIRDVWGLAHRIIRSSRSILTEQLSELGLGSAEANVLMQLFTEGDMIRQEDLVDQLDVSKPAVSRALDSLQEKGYVWRERDLTDKRAYLVVLTPKARDCTETIQAAYDEILKVAEQGITPGEAADFIRLFAKVADNLSSSRRGTRD